MRVLISAYGCEPGKGSEPGVGWNWSAQAARVAEEVVVLTRANNRELIEREEAPPNVRFEYLDVAWAMKLLKRGPRGARTYYQVWQRAAGQVGRRLHAAEPFDVVHHLTWASITMPVGVASVPAPLVIGPVGGGVGTCWPLWRTFGLRGAVYECARSALMQANLRNPAYRRRWRRASVIFVQNPETAGRLPSEVRDRVTLVPNAGIAAQEIDSEPRPRPDQPPVRALFAAQLVTWKGLGSAIEALATEAGQDIVLTVLGEGPDVQRFRRLAKRLQVADRLNFRGAVPRSEVLGEMDRSHVLLLPSQHDEGPLVVVEAMARGLRPVVLDRGGPSLSVAGAGARLPVTPVRTLPERLALACCEQAGADRTAPLQRAQDYDWALKSDHLAHAYRTAMLRAGAG